MHAYVAHFFGDQLVGQGGDSVLQVVPIVVLCRQGLLAALDLMEPALEDLDVVEQAILLVMVCETFFDHTHLHTLGPFGHYI